MMSYEYQDIVICLLKIIMVQNAQKMGWTVFMKDDKLILKKKLNMLHNNDLQTKKLIEKLIET